MTLVRRFDVDRDSDARRWDALVASEGRATAFHRTAWGHAVATSMGHRCYYLGAERDGQMVGVLPLIHVSSRLFGQSLISNAFAVYGGPVARDDFALRALDEAAAALAEELGVDVIEYRNQQRLWPDRPAKMEQYATFKRQIDPDPDVNMKAIPRKQRAMVRKGIKFGLSADVHRDVDRHFAIYAASVRNLGTPVFPKRWFSALLAAYGDDCDILTVTHEGRDVASVLSLYHGGEVLPYYGGGTRDARDLAANDFMYWALMEHAREKGMTSFDFGRSKIETGPYFFKKNWGFEPVPLAYEFHLRAGADIPDVSPLNPKYQAMIAVWRHLPLWLANALGPLVARNLA